MELVRNTRIMETIGPAQAEAAPIATDTVDDLAAGGPVPPRIQTRTIALVALAVAGGSFALHAAAAFFIPVVASVFLGYALAPIVSSLEKWRVPRALGAGIAILLVVIAACMVVQRTIDAASEVLEELPQS